MVERIACGCTYRAIEFRVVPGSPGEAIDTEIVEACRVHEDYARRAAPLEGLRRERIEALIAALPGVRRRGDGGMMIPESAVRRLLLRLSLDEWEPGIGSVLLATTLLEAVRAWVNAQGRPITDGATRHAAEAELFRLCRETKPPWLRASDEGQSVTPEEWRAEHEVPAPPEEPNAGYTDFGEGAPFGDDPILNPEAEAAQEAPAPEGLLAKVAAIRDAIPSTEVAALAAIGEVLSIIEKEKPCSGSSAASHSTSAPSDEPATARPPSDPDRTAPMAGRAEAEPNLLRRYAQHDWSCEALRLSTGEPQPCICGFAQALAADARAPEGLHQMVRPLIEHAIEAIELADNRAIAADGPVSAADELSAQDMRDIYGALKAARKLAAPPAPEGLRAALSWMASERGQVVMTFDRFIDALIESGVRLAATPPTPAEPPRPEHETDIDGNHWNGCKGCRAEARPPEGLDADRLARVLVPLGGWAGHKAADVWREGSASEVAKAIVAAYEAEYARLSAGGATKP